LQKWRCRKEALFALSALVLLCLAIVTWTQVGYWRNSIALYDHALEVTSHNDLIHYNRGTTYAKLGNQRQAIEDYDRAIEINPKYAEAYKNRGITYDKLGDRRQATEDMKTAVRLGNEDAKNYLRSHGVNWWPEM
jgi:tetratricopeptide (TPR) repeat protein